MQKHYISANNLLESSFEMALDIFESGYRPDFIVGVWRGGTPIGIAVQELLAYLGHDSDHIAIRTSSYTGINQRNKEVQVHGLHYIIERAQAKDSLLIVDDVYDTGLSVQKIILELQERCQNNTPSIKIATPYFKPKNNQTHSKPDYYLHETEQWLVFPHELDGLELNEALNNKSTLKPFETRLKKLINNNT